MAESVIRGFHEDLGPLPLTADRYGKNLITQGPEHYMTHEGKHFVLSHYFADVDADGYARIRFKTPSDVYLHLVFFVMSSGGLIVTVYRDPTFTHNASNTVSQHNKNDISTNTTPITEACHTPSGSGSGDVFIGTVPVGTSGKFNIGAGNVRDANEVILKKDTVYLIEAQSTVDNNKITLGVDFYYR